MPNSKKNKIIENIFLVVIVVMFLNFVTMMLITLFNQNYKFIPKNIEFKILFISMIIGFLLGAILLIYIYLIIKNDNPNYDKYTVVEKSYLKNITRENDKQKKAINQNQSQILLLKTRLKIANKKLKKKTKTKK